MEFHFKTIKNIGDIFEKRILIRVDFNVSEDGLVKDDFKIKKALPTINFFRSKKAKIFLISHLGSTNDVSMVNVAEYCKQFFPVIFAKTLEDAKDLKTENNEVVILENIRLLGKGEEENDLNFGKLLASLGDYYINEAFSVSHREHCSIVTLPHLLPSFAGLLFEEEVQKLSVSFSAPHPFVAICGGLKAETKIPLISSLFRNADTVFVGGALANDFFKARGEEIGESKISDEKIPKEELMNKKLVLPEDVIVLDETGKETNKDECEILGTDTIVDIGPKTSARIVGAVLKAKFVLWNGPLGWSERGFVQGTKIVAEAVGSSEANSILGGGDSVIVMDKLGLTKNFSFVSTGGGAMMDFLANGTLPGIEALEKSS